MQVKERTWQKRGEWRLWERLIPQCTPCLLLSIVLLPCMLFEAIVSLHFVQTIKPLIKNNLLLFLLFDFCYWFLDFMLWKHNIHLLTITDKSFNYCASLNWPVKFSGPKVFVVCQLGEQVGEELVGPPFVD